MLSLSSMLVVIYVQNGDGVYEQEEAAAVTTTTISTANNSNGRYDDGDEDVESQKGPSQRRRDDAQLRHRGINRKVCLEH